MYIYSQNIKSDTEDYIDYYDETLRKKQTMTTVIVWNMIEKLFLNNDIKDLIFICLLQTTPISIKNHNLDCKIVKWMALNYLFFNFFDDEETQEFFSILNSIISMPKRTAMRTKIVQVFMKIKKSIIDILKENKSKISFTLND